jgi:hypothetical protein
MMLANDKNYVKNKTRMRINQLKKHSSSNVVNSASLLTNIPTVSSVGPSIIRDNSDGEDMVSDIADDEEVLSVDNIATDSIESLNITVETIESSSKDPPLELATNSEVKSLSANVPSPGKQYAAHISRKRHQNSTANAMSLGNVRINAPQKEDDTETEKVKPENVPTEKLVVVKNEKNPIAKTPPLEKVRNDTSTKENDTETTGKEKPKNAPTEKLAAEKNGEKSKTPNLIKKKKAGFPDGWYSGVGGAMGLNVRVETQMFEKDGVGEFSSVFVRSVNQVIFEDRAINDIKYTIGPIKKKGCKTIKWDKKLMDGLKGSVVSQIDGEYNTKDNTIALTIWIKIGWVPAVALRSTMKNVPHAIGPY